MTQTTPPTIAVVDDDTAFLDLMSDLLSDEGYTTRVWKSAHGAFAAVRDLQPDLVILDIRLEHPEAGWNVLELLKLDPATTDIPVIVCSADTAFLKQKGDWFEKKGYFSLEKPFDLNDLLATIEAALPVSGRERTA